MIKCKLMLCAQAMIVDALSNSISIFSVIEEMHLPSTPGVLVHLNTLCMLERDPDDESHPADIYVEFGMIGSDMQRFPLEVNFEDKFMTRSISKIQGISIPAPGQLRVALVRDQNVLSSWDIPIIVDSPTVTSQFPIKEPPKTTPSSAN